MDILRALVVQRAAGDAEPPDGPYRPGQLVLGKYRLERCLGVGGMGAVWLARNEVLDAEVALKLIRPHLVALPPVTDRLLQEARASAKLQHPGIVRAFDFGKTDQGHPFIVMEMLHGASLADVLDTAGRLSDVAAVRVMLPVIAAIVFAHERAVVHRDVKPDNVLLVDIDGSIVPKVVDFGIAKLRDETHHGRITADGAVVGSPDYMSPEQALGYVDVDERADVWSSCVTLYELVTGELPFVAPNHNALLQAIIHQEPRPITELAAGDTWLWTIVSRGLEKDRSARYGSMRELGKELASWAEARGVNTDCTGASIANSWLRDEARREPERKVATLPPPRGTSSPSGAGSGERPTTPPHSITQHERASDGAWHRKLPWVGLGAVGLAGALAGVVMLSSSEPERGSAAVAPSASAAPTAPVATASPPILVAPVSATATALAASAPGPSAEIAVDPPPRESASARSAKSKPRKPSTTASAPLLPKEPNF